MKMPTWLLAAAVPALLLAGAACAGDDDSPSAPAAGSSTVPAASTAAKPAPPTGAIVIRADQFDSWDPHFSAFGQDVSHFYMVNRGLYMLDTNDQPQPALAAGLPQVSPDGLTYTVRLKPGLLWSDGTPVTAQQFVAGIQRTCSPAIASKYEFVVADIVGCHDYAKSNAKEPNEALREAIGVRAIDDTTVSYTLTRVRPAFTTILTMWPTFPTPTQKVAKVDDKWPAPLASAYTGPFMPSAYTEKASMELVPNPNWSGEPVKVAKLVLRYIEDTSVAMNAYRAGELDATTLPAGDYTVTKADPTLRKELQQFASPKTYGLTFNQRPGQVGEKSELRLAFSQAIDRGKMNEIVFLGSQIPTTSWMPQERSGAPAGTYDGAIGFDPAKAKANLAAGGYPEGKGFPRFALTLVNTPTNKDLGDFLQDSWKKNLGIDVAIDMVDGKTMSARFGSGDFQLALPSWQEDYPDPEAWFIGIREMAGSVNLAKCGTPQLDELIGKAKLNLNDQQRRAQYRDAERLSLSSAQCSVPLWHASSLRMVKPHISGMLEGRRGSDRFAIGDWYPEKWSTLKK